MAIKPIPRLIRWIFSVMLSLMLLMTLYRLFFFFHYKADIRPFSGSTFLMGLRFDARFVAIFGLVVLLFSAIKPLHPFKNKAAQKFWVVFISLIFLIMMIFYGADFYHYDYLKQRLNASALNFLVDTNISANMMWESYPILKINFAFLIALVIFYKWQLHVIRKINERPDATDNKLLTRGIYISVFLILSAFSFGRLGQYPLRWSDAFEFSDDFKANAALNPFQSFFSTMKFRNVKFDLSKVKADYPMMAEYLGVKNLDAEKLNYVRMEPQNDSIRNRPNVVLVICESFSAYKSSMFGNKLNPTPYFNELCKNGVFYERCFTPAFGTARGVWATITGTPDVEFPKTSSRNPLAVDQHTIINDFKDYEKFYFLGGSTTWANIRGLLKNNINGLNIYEQENFSSAAVDVWGISDKNLFLESNKLLAKQQKPFFAIIQTADNHRPYTIPKEDLNEFKKIEYPADTLKKYGFEDNGQFNAFRYTDFNFSKFIEAAKKEKYFDNTVFVFVGDHGIKGDAGNMFPKSFTQQNILAEHVPLLFYAPKLLAPLREMKVCSQMDILPSLASISGIAYKNSSFGRNLFDKNDNKERYAFIKDPDLSTIGLVGNRYYYRMCLDNQKEDFVSVTDDAPIPENKVTDSIKDRMRKLAAAWYETAKYVLVNNKKLNN